ncbi:MAG: ClbS/DfsB family four-helix bundle protein [Anaerolineales bacterium]|nr:ClbS/DfsB family four-helix bundle protein [Anaerolineales bacterium]
MVRPLNKAQLLASIQKEYTTLDNILSTQTPEILTFTTIPGAWAIKDIVAHLYEWQQMLFTWYETGLRGEMPAVPSPGYKWNQLPALNQHIYEKYRDLSPDQAMSRFRQSHQKTVQFIETLPEADLTTPGLYPWMNQNTLMSYLNSATAAHYVWAVKEIKKVLKAKG